MRAPVLFTFARLLMLKSRVRLSAGRRSSSDEAQFLAFRVEANSIRIRDKLLTTPNVLAANDKRIPAEVLI